VGTPGLFCLARVKLTVATVEIRNAEDISRAALGGAVEAGAGDVDLAVVKVGGRGSGDEAGEEGSDDELHFDGGGVWVFGIKMCLLVECG
jgi:hypothetical protein